MSTPTRTWWFLLGVAVVLGVLVFFGVSSIVPGEHLGAQLLKTLFAGPGGWLFLVPGVLLAFVFTRISLHRGKKLFSEELKPIEAFIFACAVYLFLVYASYLILTGVLYFAASGAGSAGFVFGLLFAYAVTGALPTLYLGFLVTMALMLVAFRSPRQEPGTVRSSLLRRGFIIAVFLVSLYALNAFVPIGMALNQPWLCNLAYSSRAKAECFLDAQSQSTASSKYTVIQTDYKQIKNLKDVGGKLAYAFERHDGTSGVVYDGQLVSGAYEKVGILPIAEVGGTLAYEAYKDGKQIIVWDGKEYGNEYDIALSPTDVGGKLAFLARRGTRETGLHQFVVWDGKEYGTQFQQANDIRDFSGQPLFKAKGANGDYVVVGDTSYGPYGYVSSLVVQDGHWVAKGGNNPTYYIVDGVLSAVPTNDIGQGVFVNDEFAYGAASLEHPLIMYQGKEVGRAVNSEGGPFEINGKVGYVALLPDNRAQLMVDGQPVGPAIAGRVHNIAVSEGGRVAIQVEDGSKCSAVGGAVYLDGEKVYEGCTSNPYGFYGEKLLFWIKENGMSLLWYDGEKIGHGFYGFNYIELINGKIAIAAFASTNKGIEYSLLLEQ